MVLAATPTAASARSLSMTPSESRPSGNARAVAVASGAAPSGVQNTFFCVKCQWNKPLALLRMRGNQKICAPDVNSYESIQKRWRTQRSLREWFKGLSPSETTDWYRRHQQTGAGIKRDFDSMRYEEKKSNFAETREASVDMFIPWRAFKRNCLMEGMTPAAAAHEFCELVNDPAVTCKFARGQWLGPDWSGISVQNSKVTQDGYEIQRGVEVDSSAQLERLTRGGQALVDHRVNSLSHSSASGGQHLSVDTPVVANASVMQQHVPHAPSDIMMQALQQEVAPKRGRAMALWRRFLLCHGVGLWPSRTNAQHDKFSSLLFCYCFLLFYIC